MSRLRKQARSMGVTFRTAFHVARELKRARLLPDDRDLAADMVVSELASRNSDLWARAAANPEVNWEALMELVFQIVLLAVKIILLF